MKSATSFLLLVNLGAGKVLFPQFSQPSESPFLSLRIPPLCYSILLYFTLHTKKDHPIEEFSLGHLFQHKEFFIKIQLLPSMVVLQKLRQKDCCEFKANLGYVVSLS